MAEFLILVGAIFWLGLVGSLTPRRWGDDSHSICECQICVVNSGFHTDIIVARQDQICDGHNYFEEKELTTGSGVSYKYLSFGWGERSFYREPPTVIKEFLVAGFKALFLPTPAVMRVQRHFSIPQNHALKCVGVSRSGYLTHIPHPQLSHGLRVLKASAKSRQLLSKNT
ncbi:MAG: DUF2459 domain-containing protein [Symploca sp. SIO2B6]|nr:DUF2459 domain-containing protein [Symploca sp. SIO2B6]